MSRQVFVPTAGDPFVFKYWLNFYDREVAPRVDTLHVGQFGPADPRGIEVIQQLCSERDIKFKSENGPNWGFAESFENAYSLYVNQKDEDSILLLETDCFVFDGTILDEYFNQIESKQKRLIASRRPASTDICVENPSVKLENRLDCNGLWPCFLFTRNKDFSQAYQNMILYLKDIEHPNAIVHDPDLVFNNRRGNEEFVAFGFLLQSLMGPSEITFITQIRGNKTDSKWTNFGRLEQMSLEGNVLRDKQEMAIIYSPSSERLLLPRSPLALFTSAKDLPAEYIGIYKACILTGAESNSGLKELEDRYLGAIEKAITTFNYNRRKIDEYCNIFKEWAR